MTREDSEQPKKRSRKRTVKPTAEELKDAYDRGYTDGATLWRKVREGSFPAPIKLGPNITAWRVSDIQKWLLEVTK